MSRLIDGDPRRTQCEEGPRSGGFDNNANYLVARPEAQSFISQMDAATAPIVGCVHHSLCTRPLALQPPSFSRPCRPLSLPLRCMVV